jgi:hypothetical protein
MDQRTRPWRWTILGIGASLAWRLPGGGKTGTPEHFATRGITPIEPPRPATDFALDTVTGLLVSLIHAPPQETARPGAGGKQC